MIFARRAPDPLFALLIALLAVSAPGWVRRALAQDPAPARPAATQAQHPSDDEDEDDDDSIDLDDSDDLRSDQGGAAAMEKDAPGDDEEMGEDSDEDDEDEAAESGEAPKTAPENAPENARKPAPAPYDGSQAEP